MVVLAPPLWGKLAKNVPLKEMIQEKINVDVFVVNDLCGTDLFYSKLPDYNKGVEFLTLITLSTGIDCKTVKMRGFFGWNENELEGLVKIGIPSDDFGLIGAAQYGLFNTK